MPISPSATPAAVASATDASAVSQPAAIASPSLRRARQHEK